MDSNVVTREMKKRIWPVLREHGFDVSTSRTAWRYRPNRIEAIEFVSLGHYQAEKCGCTSFSFQVELGSALPANADYQERASRKDWPRPRSVDAEFRFLVPCIRSVSSYEETLWYVDSDGKNLSRQLEDLVKRLNGIAWPWFDRWADDHWILRMLEKGEDSDDGTVWYHPKAVGQRGVLMGMLKNRLGVS